MKLANRPGEIFLAIMNNFKTLQEKEKEKEKEKEEGSAVIFRFWIDKTVLQRLLFLFFYYFLIYFFYYFLILD